MNGKTFALLCVVAGLLCLSTPAKADPVVFNEPGYNSSGGVGSSTSFTLTGFTGQLDSLTFSEGNNDCESNAYILNCWDNSNGNFGTFSYYNAYDGADSQSSSGYGNFTGDYWEVTESINGNTPQTIYDFIGGGPYTTFNFSVPLNQTVSAGDSVTFDIQVTGINAPCGGNNSGCYGSRGYQTTAGYGIGGIDINAESVPEPGSLALLGSGMFGLVGIIRRRFIQR